MMSGPGAAQFLARITPSSPDSLQNHYSTLSCLLHPETGGIVDDTIISRLDADKFYVVTNAGCREKDIEYLTSELERWQADGQPAVNWEQLDDYGLIALQGPLSSAILSEVMSNTSAQEKLETLYFGQSRYITIQAGSQEIPNILVSRGGYTGEDGFELSIPGAEASVAVAKALFESAGPEKLHWAGLGARDSLRLEAGMCLYGHDLDDTTTPVEAALSWVVSKERRQTGGFHGAEKILAQLKPKSKGGQGVEKRRVGLIVQGAPAREGAEVQDSEGQKVGKVTSGCPSPTLKQNIAMAYVKDGLHKSGTELFAVVRGKKRKAVVTKMPFVPSKYWKQTAAG